jgi:hypothetical protein
MSNNFSSPSNQQILAKITFRFWVCFISSLAILPVFFIMGIVGAAETTDEVIVEVCALLAFLVIAIASIFYLLFLYTVWQQIPPDIARTTPGKAVGFLFIPFFNFYWQFVAVYGLGKDLNQTLKQAGLQPRVNEIVGLVYCVATVTYCIPGISTIIAIVSLVNGMIYLFSLKDGVVELLTAQQPLDDNIVTSCFNNTMDQ